MKKLFLFIGTAFLLHACGGGSGDSPSASATPVKGVITDGLELLDVEGGFQRAIRRSIEGKVVEEGMLKNGKRNGTWVVFNTEKGFVSSVANFVDDVYSGPYLKFNNFGQLELSCGYTNNQLDGYFAKYERAKLIEEGYYKKGQYDGNYTKYFMGKDIPQQKLQYKNGQLHGKAQYFSEQGDLLMEYEYKNGEKLGGGIVQKKE